MPVLFFPNWNILRLVLASGLVPSELACAPAGAGRDAQGRLWLDLSSMPSRELIAALSRVGVQALGGTESPTEQVRCWAELLPLQESHLSAPGKILCIGPDRGAAKFVARLRRAGCNSPSVLLHDAQQDRTAWVACHQPPASAFFQIAESSSQFEVFIEQSPGVWVLAGWEHPLPQQLVIPAHSLLLVRPPNKISVAAALPATRLDEEYRLPPRPLPRSLGPTTLAIPVSLKLVPRGPSAPETLWVLEQDELNEFLTACASADERQLRRLEAASETNGTSARLIIRSTDEHHQSSVMIPGRARGYARDPQIEELHVPANRELRPRVRTRELKAILSATPECLVWLEASPTGLPTVHQVERSRFRNFSQLVEYAVPARVELASEILADPFPLPRCAQVDEISIGAEFEPPIPISEAEELLQEPEKSASGPGWLRRLLAKVQTHLLQESPAEAEASAFSESPRTPVVPTDRRMAQGLGSPESLRHGPDWTARRQELEKLLFEEINRLPQETRAAKWAALASVYTKIGNSGDAAVCWMNAVWDKPSPPANWLAQWRTAECLAAKLPDSQRFLDRWLSVRQPGIGRVVAAYAVEAGQTQNPTEFLEALPRILMFLEQNFEDLPLRSAWLARVSAARVCEGDALGLARWRDRLLGRLEDRGPALDLDVPSFLRFHGSVSGERFQAARKCLESVREKVHGWIHRHGKIGRKLQADRLLQWAGLIAEKDATLAYADLMLAWGLGGLGERILSNNWAGRARKDLNGATAQGVDPAAHAVLGDLFVHRIKDAQEGRLPRPGLPADLRPRLEALPEFARFAVDRLREHSLILEPLSTVRAYRGRDLKSFWGSDRLAERLSLLAEGNEPALLAEEAAALLQLCQQAPTSEVVPRVILTVLEIAPNLAQPLRLQVLEYLPSALEWLDFWLASTRINSADRRESLVRYRARMLKAGFGLAAMLSPADAQAPIHQLVEQLCRLGAPIREPLLRVAGPAFRAMRRLRLRGEAAMLGELLELEADAGERLGVRSLTARLGQAIGWFATGNEDAGYRVLHDAGEALYLSRELTTRDRTQLALAYAEALGFAPPVIAHGRLSELFERLDASSSKGSTKLFDQPEDISTQGSTNRYFTLKPLQLIDVVVRSIVTDEFALGPSVRNWLDADEFRIRGRIHRDLATVLREEGIG